VAQGVCLKLDPAAIIPMEKLRDYVLPPTHAEGRTKAAYLARLGYSQDDWPRLEADLRQQLLPREATPAGPSPYGLKYGDSRAGDCPERSDRVDRTIWIVLHGESIPRLVTLIPEDRS
jgi:hypothetical protein